MKKRSEPLKKQEKNKSKISQIYKENWRLIRSTKNYIWIILGLFIFSIIFGFLTPGLFEEQISKIVRELVEKTQGLSGIELIRFIFINNVQASFIGMVLGVFLGIFSILLTVLNGYVIGFVINKSVEVSGASILWMLLPHGIFEIPAVILSLALGLKLGSFVFFRHKNYWNEFWKLLKQSFLVFVFFIIPLLIIAAIIEGILISLVG